MSRPCWSAVRMHRSGCAGSTVQHRSSLPVAASQMARGSGAASVLRASRLAWRHICCPAGFDPVLCSPPDQLVSQPLQLRPARNLRLPLSGQRALTLLLGRYGCRRMCPWVQQVRKPEGGQAGMRHVCCLQESAQQAGANQRLTAAAHSAPPNRMREQLSPAAMMLARTLST